MKSKDISTEEKILEAAKEVFLKKGFDGARMQEIADTAGINKAMLHYYFRTKDRLFEHIFVTAISNIFPKVGGIFISDAPFEDKIRAFIRDYLSFILQNPFLPIFILHEMSANPERLIEHFTKFNFNEKVGYLQSELDQKIAAGEYRPIRVEQLIINIMSMVIFPVAAKPIMKHIFSFNDDTYQAVMEERKTFIADFVLSALRL